MPRSRKVARKGKIVGVEIASLAELEPLLLDTADVWLILDLDHTLLRAPTPFGGEPWYYHRIEVHRAAGRPEREAILAGNDDWEHAQTQLTPIAMESDGPRRVADWQARGITVLGLTARRPEIAALTRTHLRGVGFDLARTAPALRAPFFLDGIAYVGPLARKGDELAKLLAQTKPARLVFADDRAEHIRTVGEHAARLGIRYDGRRMTAGDRYFREFVPDKNY